MFDPDLRAELTEDKIAILRTAGNILIDSGLLEAQKLRYIQRAVGGALDETDESLLPRIREARLNVKVIDTVQQFFQSLNSGTKR